MAREGAAVAGRIMGFFGDRGVDCSVVDEHKSLLVTLYADGRCREFRWGLRPPPGGSCWKRLSRLLEWEYNRLKRAR